MQTRLKITSKGQVTLRKELLGHLGVQPGDAIIVTTLPSGEAKVTAAPRNGIEAFFGSIKNTKNIHLTLDEIEEAIGRAWAGNR